MARCAQCEIAIINGIRCHEEGCPRMWEDVEAECAECGSTYIPQDKHDRFCCLDCSSIYYGLLVSELELYEGD